MRIITLDGKHYVAEMQWRDIHTLKPRLRDFAEVAQELGIKPQKPQGTFILGMSKTNAVVGFVDDSINVPRKGKLLSLAGTLASHLDDGIYVAPLGNDGEFWVLAVVDSMVSPSTDQMVGPEILESQIGLIQSLLPNLDIHLEQGVTLSVFDGHDWSLADAISKATPVPVVHLGKTGGSVSPLVLVGGILTLGLIGGGLYVMMDEPVKTGPSQAEIEAQQRAAYVASIQGYTMTVLPLTGEWVHEARMAVDRLYPVERYGWAFEGADCTTQGCTIFYTTDDKAPRSLDSLMASLGKPVETASLGTDGRTFQLAEPVKAQGYVALDEMAINNLPEQVSIMQAWERFIGLAPLRLPGIKTEKKGEIEDYSMLAPPPAGLPGVVKGTLAVSGLDPQAIPSVMGHLAELPVTPSRLAWSYGLSQTPKAWRIELTYLARK